MGDVMTDENELIRMIRSTTEASMSASIDAAALERYRLDEAAIMAVANAVGIESAEIAGIQVFLKGHVRQVKATIGFSAAAPPATAIVEADPIKAAEDALEAAEILAVLREVEWGGDGWDDMGPVCPSCGGEEPDDILNEIWREHLASSPGSSPPRNPPGHKPDCRLAAALRGAP